MGGQRVGSRRRAAGTAVQQSDLCSAVFAHSVHLPLSRCVAATLPHSTLPTTTPPPPLLHRPILSLPSALHCPPHPHNPVHLSNYYHVPVI